MSEGTEKNNFWSCPTDLTLPPLEVNEDCSSYYETCSTKSWSGKVSAYNPSDDSNNWECIEIKEGELKFKNCKPDAFGRHREMVFMFEGEAEIPIEIGDKFEIIISYE